MKNYNNCFFYLIVTVFAVLGNCYAQDLHGSVSTPEYSGGLGALREFIKQNIVVPEKLTKDGTGGTVTLSYIISEKGEVEDVKILRGIDKECDAEAIRVSKLISGWHPATQIGKPISVKIVMPIEFDSGKKKTGEQEVKVKGKIIDRLSGKPIVGSLILIKGTHHGTITNKEGFYNLTVPNKETELEYSCMGYITKTEKVEENCTINIELLAHDFVVDFNSNQLK